MDVSLYQAAAAMNATEHWQEMISDNLANASISGSRKQEVSFSAIQAGLMSGTTGQINSNFVIPSATSEVNFQPGELHPSGNTLDVALEGKGFFSVELPDGQTGYTRNGQFQLDTKGQLVNTQGYPVLGDSGPLKFDIRKKDLITISTKGEIRQGELSKGKLKIAEFENPGQLTAMNRTLFRADNPATTPLDSPDTVVRQGYSESANSSPTVEMASLITAMRMFESNQKVLQMQGDRMSREITELANPS